MSSENWTAGPWKTSRTLILAGEDITIYDECADRIIVVRGKDVPYSIACANARLIASAPELYAALKAMREEFEAYPRDIGAPGSEAREQQDRQRAACEQADAALRAARGEA